MEKTNTRLMVCFAALAFVLSTLMMATAAMAQNGNTCVYANDDVFPLNGPNTVDGYLVTSTSQTYLSPVLTGGDGSGDSQIQNIVMHPTKSILYASNGHSGDIAAMKINPATCQLTLIADYPLDGSDGEGIGLAIRPDGRRMYAAGVHSAELNVVDILQDGSLTKVRQKMSLLNKPSDMAVSPDGTTLIVGVPKAPGNGEELISYSIDPLTGILTQVSMIFANGYPGGMAIDAQSKFVYVEEPDYDQLSIGLFEIGAGSSLTFIRTYNFTEIMGQTIAADALLSVNGKYLYVTNPDLASISTLQVHSVTGALKYVTTTSDGTIGFSGPVGLATSKNGDFVFTADQILYGDMGVFAAARDGSLASLGTFPMTSSGMPQWLAAKSF